MTQLKNLNTEKILKTISILFAIIYILFLFWNRLFRSRLPKTLDGIYTTYQVTVFILLLLLSIFMIIYTLKSLLHKQKKGIIKLYIEKILNSTSGYFFITYVLNAPKILYEWLYQYITIRSFIEKFGVKIWNMDPYKYCKHLIFIIYFIRIFVCIIFIIDIIYFNKFDYFYKSLLLLLVILTLRCCIFILKDLSAKNKLYIEKEFLIIEVNENKDGFYAEPKEQYKEIFNDNQINKLTTTWIAYLANCMFADKFYEYDDHYKKYIDLICYSIYTIGWGYILYRWYYTIILPESGITLAFSFLQGKLESFKNAKPYASENKLCRRHITTQNKQTIQQKIQSIVSEIPNSNPVNSQEITINKKATSYVQEQKHHDDIQNNT